jgi:hypothetical protein
VDLVRKQDKYGIAPSPSPGYVGSATQAVAVAAIRSTIQLANPAPVPIRDIAEARLQDQRAEAITALALVPRSESARIHHAQHGPAGSRKDLSKSRRESERHYRLSIPPGAITESMGTPWWCTTAAPDTQADVGPGTVETSPKRDLVARPVVQLGGPRRFVRRHLPDMFQRAAAPWVIPVA